MAIYLRFVSLTVTTAHTEKTYRFDRPVTVISGPIGTGKSSLLMLLKYAVGGRAMLTPAVRENVQSVRAEVVIGNERVVLRRSIESSGDDSVDVLDPHSLALERSLSLRLPDQDTSLSAFLLDSLGFPRERIAARREGVARSQSLTFNDLFAYVYLQAREIDRQVVGHLEQWFEPKRKELFRLMFSLTDSELLELKRVANELTDRLKATTAEHENISRFLRTSDPRSDDELRAEQRQLHEVLHNAESALATLRDDLHERSAADAVLRDELNTAIIEAQKTSEEVLAAQEVVKARQSVVAQVELDLARLERSATAIDKLSPFEFVVCPRCMQSLISRTVDENHCIVCLQPNPQDDEINPAAVAHIRSDLHRQLEEARALQDADERLLDAAEQRSHGAAFLVSSLRRQLDAQTRSSVAPRFEAIAEASARVSILKSNIDAISNLRGSWERVRLIEQAVKSIKAERRQTNRDVKERSARLAARQNLISDLSDDFGTLLSSWDLPWVRSAIIDSQNFLPIVNGQPFESQQASGGGIATSINVAYSLTLVTFGLNHPDILVPSLLIIDSPRKAFGSNEADRLRATQIYNRFQTLADAYGDRLQLIIADNDAPPISGNSIGRLEFDYGNPMVPGVRHPGPEMVRRIEDEYGDSDLR